MNNTLRELLAVTEAICVRERTRARKEFPMANSLEYLDPQYGEAYQALNLVRELVQEHDDRLVAEVARFGT